MFPILLQSALWERNMYNPNRSKAEERLSIERRWAQLRAVSFLFARVWVRAWKEQPALLRAEFLRSRQKRFPQLLEDFRGWGNRL